MGGTLPKKNIKTAQGKNKKQEQKEALSKEAT